MVYDRLIVVEQDHGVFIFEYKVIRYKCQLKVLQFIRTQMKISKIKIFEEDKFGSDVITMIVFSHDAQIMQLFSSYTQYLAVEKTIGKFKFIREYALNIHTYGTQKQIIAMNQEYLVTLMINPVTKGYLLRLLKRDYKSADSTLFIYEVPINMFNSQFLYMKFLKGSYNTLLFATTRGIQLIYILNPKLHLIGEMEPKYYG